MNKAYISLGGNHVNTLDYFDFVYQKWENKIVKKSSVYKTESWGFKTNTPFYNQVILIQTKLDSQKLLQECLKIEQQCFRERLTKGYSSRTLDLDILYFNTAIINTVDLKVPHPLLQQRNFVLLPLNEITPDFKHPQLNKTNSELLKECSDKCEIEKLDAI